MRFGDLNELRRELYILRTLIGVQGILFLMVFSFLKS